MEDFIEEMTDQMSDETNFTVYPDLTTAIIRPIKSDGLSFNELLSTIRTGIIQTFSPE